MRALTFALSLTVAVSTAAAQAQERKPFTIDTMWAIQRVGTPAVSPDGLQVAYTVTTYDVDENRGNADIWIVPTAGGDARRVTTNPASDSGPVWSPDGTRLAFVSRREADKAAQIYVIDVRGGEAMRITEMPLGAGSVKWLPDGTRLAFVSHVIAGHESTEATTKALEAREKNKVKARVTENRLYRFWDRWLTDEEFPHLFVVDIATKKVTDLLPGSKRLFGLQEGSGDYDLSPDGSTIVFSALASPEPYRSLNYDLFSVPTAGGDVKNLTSDNPASDTGPVFSPDGTRIAYGREVKAAGWPDYTRAGRDGRAKRRHADAHRRLGQQRRQLAVDRRRRDAAVCRGGQRAHQPLCDRRRGRRATRAASRRRAGRRGGHARRAMSSSSGTRSMRRRSWRW